jgi:nitrous oxidase accessory protein NosD
VGLLVRPATAGTTYNVSTVAQLQAAISAVNGGPGGDLIVLAPGFYALTSQLTIDQDVSIHGDPLAPTVIDGGGLVDILHANAHNITVQNLTLENASTAITYQGSGVFSGTGLTITGSRTGFHPGDGGGATFFTNSTIANNRVDGIIIQCAELHLTNVTVSNNAAGVNFDFPCGERMQITNSRGSLPAKPVVARKPEAMS